MTENKSQIDNKQHNNVVQEGSNKGIQFDPNNPNHFKTSSLQDLDLDGNYSLPLFDGMNSESAFELLNIYEDIRHFYFKTEDMPKIVAGICEAMENLTKLTNDIQVVKDAVNLYGITEEGFMIKYSRTREEAQKALEYIATCTLGYHVLNVLLNTWAFCDLHVPF